MEPRSTRGVIASHSIINSLAVQAEHAPTRLGKAGRTLAREVEAYVGFWAEARDAVSEPSFRAPSSVNVPRCRRCGSRTERPVDRCGRCAGLR